MKKLVHLFTFLAIILAGCGGPTALPPATPTNTATKPPRTEPSAIPTHTPSITPTPEISVIPTLEYPPAGEVMDNARGDRRDRMAWFFDWTDVPGATLYELLVIHSGATEPAIQETVNHSSYYDDDFALGTTALTQWTWKVRARTGGQWGEWSEPGVFNVEEMNTDAAWPSGEICDRAELPVNRTGPVEGLPVVLPGGLSISEFALIKNSPLEHDYFEPVGTTREAVFLLHAADRGAELPGSHVFEEQTQAFPDEIIHHPIPFQGETLSATEYRTDSPTGYKKSGKVLHGGKVIFEVAPEPLVADYLFRRLQATETDWFLEIAHGIAVSPVVCLLGDVIQSGISLSTRYGYREAFDFQLLDQKPFYFFNQDGKIGFSYNGQMSWLGYDEIPHFGERYGAVQIVPKHWENRVAFFARRGDNWYYVEIGKAP